MERQKKTKDKKKILNNQLLFDFETNSLTEHIIEHEVVKAEKKNTAKIFRKGFVAIKKCHKKRKIRKINQI